MPLPVYVINLDRRPDRWEQISSNLERVGVEAERVPAVDAELPVHKEQWEAYVSRNKSVHSMDLGAVACALSHAKSLERFLDSIHPAALILEDDVEISTDTASLLHSTNWWPKGAMVIRLEAGGGGSFSTKWQDYSPLWGVSGRTPSGRELRRLERRSCGSGAYLINLEGAEIVLNTLKHPNMPMDHILFDLRHSKTARKLHTIQVIPSMARQRDPVGDSDLISFHLSNKSQMSRRKSRRYKRKLLGIPYRIRYSVLMSLRKIRKVSVSYRDSV